MKKLIALFGRSNIGKSETLREVHAKLAALASESVPAHEIIDTSDIRAVLIINGLKVGIETQGDPNSRLRKSLELFESIECELIICASRSRGSTKDLIKNLNPPYKISWRGQSSVSVPEYRRESNVSMAQLIFEEAENTLYT